MKNNVAILTLGCKVNQAESEQIASMLISKGYRVVDFKENPDIFIINTCAVTRESGHKSRKLVRRALSKNPESLVIATGCYINYEDFNPSNIKEDVLFFRNEDKQKIIDLIPLLDEKGKNNKEELKPVFHTRGLVKIQDGCDDFCSYCVVPYLRGKPRSKKPSEVVGEIDGLVKAGVKEVVITGVHIGKYGIDLEKEASLLSLLKKVLKIKALKRVRLSSIDVGEINDEIIKLVAGERRICRHFHIPVQSGDDQILSAMGRNYKVKDFFDKIKVIQRGIKDVAVTTDVIVGFPGESDSSFEKTYNLLKELDLKKIHVFKYSPRKKTRAAEMVNQVSIEEKRKRSKKLQELSDSLGSRFAKKSIGAEVEVLVEERKGLYQHGLTDNYLKVYFESKDDLKGKLVKVKVLKTEKHLAFGELIS